ncbi:MAG: hypothetical protein RL757_1662 [Bacteroidota bacterium]
MIFKTTIPTLLLALAMAFAPHAHAQTLPKGMTKVTSVEGITEYKLENGLRVLLFPDNSKQTLTVNITYVVGSNHEGLGETGMAHLLEHMVFKGSPRHTNIPKELNDHGCDFNGTTWYDRTNYYETFPASDENLTWALDLESDRMVNSYIAKKDLETEFSVVRNEFEMGENNPEGVLMERVLSTSYLWHNYGKTTIGNRSDIENVPIENLQAFYRKFYQPDNAILLVAGKMDEEKALALISKFFAPIQKPSRVLQKSWTAEPVQDGERVVALRRVGEGQVLSAAYHTSSGSHPDYAGIEILNEILTNNPSGRLYKNLIEGKKAATMWSYVHPGKDPSFIYLNVNVLNSQNIDVARAVFTQTLDDLATNPPTEEEITRAKTTILRRFEELTRTSSKLGTAITDFVAMGDWRMGFIYRDNVEKATAADIARVAKQYFKPSNRTLGVFMPDAKPDRSEIPNVPDVSALVEGYKGKAVMAAGEAFDPSPENVDKRTKRTTEGGIKMALLQKTTRGNTVNMALVFRLGDEKSLMNQGNAIAAVADLLMKGTKTKTEAQIKDAFDNLKATVSVRQSLNRVGIDIETTKENLPKVIDLVVEMLRESNFPEAKLEEYRQQQMQQIEQQKADPQALAFVELQRTMRKVPKGDIRYTATLDEEEMAAKALKLADVKMAYEKFFGINDGTTVSIVGDFDETVAKKQLLDGLKGWNAKTPFKPLVNKFENVTTVNKNIKTPDKANAMFFAGQNLQMRDDNPDYVALMVGNHILGGGALSSRLADRIRQKEGISYGVGSWLSVPSIDDAATFGAYAIYAPENVEKLESAFKDEIARILKDGITEKELEDAKKGILQNNIVERSQDGSLASSLNSQLILNRTMKFNADLEARLSKLTVADVNAMLRKNIDVSKITMIKAGDFDKVKKP